MLYLFIFVLDAELFYLFIYLVIIVLFAITFHCSQCKLNSATSPSSLQRASHPGFADAQEDAQEVRHTHTEGAKGRTDMGKVIQV